MDDTSDGGIVYKLVILGERSVMVTKVATGQNNKTSHLLLDS